MAALCVKCQKQRMTASRFRIVLEPAMRHVFHTYWRFARAATLGVRGLVIDGQNRVLLIRHSYVSGWHLPGGGVETGETMLAALTRELHEEGNIELAVAPALYGIYFNRRASRRDHVALYVVRDFSQNGLPKPNFEIAEAGFFARDNLPDGTTEGTRARIAEVFDGKPSSEFW
jgi:ADP-ribose pyrophosphatase YjhB (NUDIX family)